LLPSALAAALVGCDGESAFDVSAMDAGPPSARYESVCAPWAARFCDFQQHCSGYYEPWELPSQCVQRMTLTCELVAGDPDIAFDPARTAACPEPDSGGCSSPLDHMCLGPGRAPVGAACLAAEACASGYCSPRYASNATAEPCGYCAAVVVRACKAACTAKESCVPAPDGGERCVALADNDAGCAKASDCRSYICSGGFCRAPSLTGQPCGMDAGDPYCANPADFCSMGGLCNPQKSAYYGEPCVSAEDKIICRGYAACDYTNNVCVPPAGDGDFCDTAQALGCLAPAACLDHVCRFPDPRLCSSR
jgi:hypothetical protein